MREIVMRAVDTNVLVRIAVRDDEKQFDAAELFISQGAWVSHLVLVEAAWVLASFYDFSYPQQATFVENMLAHEFLRLQDPDIVEMALARFKHQKKLSFTDCLALEIARKAGHTPLGTFDKALGKLPGAKAL
jgi:predicted nucleic-acid-binding protein